MSDYEGCLECNQVVNEIGIPDYMKYIDGFSLVRLDGENSHSFNTRGCEVGISILSGMCDITVDGQTFNKIGSRENVFAGVPTGVYVPRDSNLTLGGGRATVAVCRGKCAIKFRPAVITPNLVRVMTVGRDNWQREVRILIGPDGPSENLILGETLNPPGNWSGTPPHRHEHANLPKESLHEELYYFKTEKPQGWGIQRLYSPERGTNDLLYLQDGTVTFMPRGYHQIVAAPGYHLYYLFFLSGEGKELIGHEDPDHCWIKEES